MTPLEVPAALRRVLGDEAGRSALATSPKISGSGLTAEYMQSVAAGLALPMLVLDGVVFSQSYQQSPSTLSRLNETLRTSGVESLVFVGPEEAGKLYGARGARDGALLITTRK